MHIFDSNNVIFVLTFFNSCRGFTALEQDKLQKLYLTKYYGQRI